MQKIKFKAKCPYEIGDKIQFEKGGKTQTMDVTDIITQVNRRHNIYFRVGRLV